MKSFYGEADKGSQYPGWYYGNRVEEIANSIRVKENSLKQGFVPKADRDDFERNLDKERERLEKIKEQMPKVSGKEKDALAEKVKATGAKLAEAMPSRSDMMKGIVDEHEEVHRNCDPVMALDPELAAATNIKLDEKGLCSRNAATRAWQLGRKILEESTNPETLRKD